MTNNERPAGECCPVFDPTPWDKKSHIWKDKLFIQDSIPQFLHIPLPGSMGKTMARMTKQALEANAMVEGSDFMLLAYDPSPWKSILYMSVTQEVPGAVNVKFSGNYISKVYDGPYSSAPKYLKDSLQYIKDLGKTVKKFYFYYTTCPKCAKKYGHNYIVSLAEV